MRSWELSELQRQALAKRGDIEKLDAAIERLENMLVVAREFTAHFDGRRRAIQAKRYDLRAGGRRGLHDDGGYPSSGATVSQVAEDERLALEERHLEEDQQRQMHDRRVETVDGAGFRRSWSPLNPNDVEQKLHHTRRVRSVAASDLVTLEGQLSDGQRCQVGIEAPAVAEHRDRLAAIRARHGLPEPVTAG